MLRILKALTNAILAITVHLRIYYKFLSILPKEPAFNTNQNKVLIPLIYWGTTKAVWFQILMSLKFMKLGNDILFVYDNRPTAGSHVLPFFLMTIAKVFIYRIKHDQNLDFIDLRTLKKQAVTKNGVNNATLAAYFNAQWEQRKSIDFECSEEYSQSIKKYEDIVGKIQYVLSKHKIDLCFCPGGLYGSSFLWRKMCEENGVRFSSFESEQITIISPNGAASHRGDIVAKFQNYHSLESSEKLSFLRTQRKLLLMIYTNAIF